MKYVIDLYDDSTDTFEATADNVMTIMVRNLDGKDISKEAYVDIFLSKNALLGFGTELIRLAHSFHEGKHFHLEPCSESDIVQRLGVFLSPNSAQTMISCDGDHPIDEYILPNNSDEK